MEITELLTKKGNYNFNVNEWGSCQYSGALAMYKSYFELKKEYSKEKILEYLKYEFGYEISMSGIRNDEEAIDKFFDILLKQKKWNLSNIDDYDNYESLNEYDKELVYTIRRAVSADDLFFIGRNSAFDLWKTAPLVAESYFIDLVIKNVPNSENPIGIEKGPVCNICAQADNILTGICCALLVDYGIVKNLNSFKRFDT